MSSLASAEPRDQTGRMTLLSDAVRTAITDAPCSLRALAREAGVPHSTLSHLLQGEREATPEVAKKVAAALERWARSCARAARRIRRILDTARR